MGKVCVYRVMTYILSDMLNKDESNQNEKTRNRTRYLLKEKSMKNILKVRMLGGFTLEYKGKELVLDRNNVSKTTQLFQLLLLHTQDGGISKACLLYTSKYRCLYGYDGSRRKTDVP